MYHDPVALYRLPRKPATLSRSYEEPSEPFNWLLAFVAVIVLALLFGLLYWLSPGSEVGSVALVGSFYPHTFEGARAYLGKKTDRPLPGRATRLQARDDGSIAIKYQRTDVVTYKPDGSIVLNSDGYHTLTTRQRINEYTPIRTWSERGVMYVGKGYPWKEPGLPYADGTIINPDKTITLPPHAQKELRSREELSRRITKYARLMRTAIEKGEIGEPSLGDCLMCQMELSVRLTGSTGSVSGQKIQYSKGYAADAASNEIKLEDLTHKGPSPASHYPDHLEEGYVMGSLLANAIIARNYGNPQAVYSMIIGRNDGKWAAQIVRWYLRSLLPRLTERA